MEDYTLYMVLASILTVALAVAIHTFLKPSTAKSGKVAMSSMEFRPFKLIKKENASHDTRRLTFALQSPDTRLGLPIGQHISFRFVDENGKGVQRSYTPVTGDEVLGTVTFVIKIYKAGVHPKFPEGGKMSQHVDSLEIGDTLDMKGPKGHLNYQGRGKFTVKEMRKPLSHRHAKKFGMIAGGTGITPMLQVIAAIFRDTKDKTTTMSLLYANQSEDDILVREELESYAKEYPDRFKLHYTVDRPPQGWAYSKGFVTKEMIEQFLPPPSEGTHILMCGPAPMIKFACIPNLDALGFKEDQRFSF